MNSYAEGPREPEAFSKSLSEACGSEFAASEQFRAPQLLEPARNNRWHLLNPYSSNPLIVTSATLAHRPPC